jgi:hypothetical protein
MEQQSIEQHRTNSPLESGADFNQQQATPQPKVEPSQGLGIEQGDFPPLQQSRPEETARRSQPKTNNIPISDGKGPDAGKHDDDSEDITLSEIDSTDEYEKPGPPAQNDTQKQPEQSHYEGQQPTMPSQGH